MTVPKRSDPTPKYEVKTWRDLTPLNVSVGTMLHNLTGTWRYVRPRYEDKMPACQNSCPAGNDIEGWIKLLFKRDYEQAYWHLKREQPFPTILGRVCFRFCEQACNRAPLDSAVSINELERFVGDQVSPTAPPPDLPAYNGKSLAVVGSGPAGLSAAYFARRLGFQVTIFEADPEMGGLLRYGIPGYRLPRDILAAEIQGLKNMGIEIQPGTRVGQDISFRQLRSEFDYLFLATGLSKDRKLDLVGEDQCPPVMSGLEVLKDLASGRKVDLGKRVVVIGGGNTALDVARSAIRLGAEVTVAYRRGPEEMPAHPEEVLDASEEGVKFLYLVAPESITLDHNRGIKKLVLARMDLGPPDESGRRRPVPIAGAFLEMEAETVLTAVGEEPDFAYLQGEVQTRPGLVPVDEGLQAVAGDDQGARIFAGGDIIAGPRTVIHAVAAGKRAAIAMDVHRRGLNIGQVLSAITIGSGPALSFSRYMGWASVNPIPQDLSQVVDAQKIVYDYFQKKPPIAKRIASPESRHRSFEAYHHTWSEAEALEEATRCLHCGRCLECDNCLIFCPEVSVLVKGGDQFGYAVDYDYCKGCGLCQAECPRWAITMIDEDNPLDQEA